MAQVRVRLQTAHVQLLFEGEEAVFERQVEPLLLHVARRGSRRASSGTPDARSAEPAPQAAETAAGQAPNGWQPAATHFHTFQRQLAEAPESDGARIAAYAFYLWNYEKRETFGTEELTGCFQADEATVPDDLAGRCRALEDRRILQPAAQEETWRLTPRGTNRVRKWLR